MALTFKPIKLNDTGAEVRKVSTLLKKHGSTIKPTSKFHIGVRSAVVAFQKKNKLPATGVVDKKTWDKLNKEPIKVKLSKFKIAK